ncbi:hypothetical protein NV379_04910 [Paenibacillus sp. N1-5-1-14]|uniref:hypothetical protein n=1 Tax=Paenibacillus radicibacter TaxID=2972488 RepID=UPI002158B62E|nr:hypothetical protein [Paenibacillus radicibacter]MCR8641990.1 hypothetical protein [Paenibacillus radicibacter]
MSQEAFQFIDFIFVFFIIILSLLFVKSIFFKRYLQNINGFSLASISLISVIVSSALLYFLGYAADELPKLELVRHNTFKYLAIVILAIINSVIAVKIRNNTP